MSVPRRCGRSALVTLSAPDQPVRSNYCLTHRQCSASSFFGSKHTSPHRPGALGFSHAQVFGFAVPPNGQMTAHTGGRTIRAKETLGIIVEIARPSIAVLSAKCICLSNSVGCDGPTSRQQERSKSETSRVYQISDAAEDCGGFFSEENSGEAATASVVAFAGLKLCGPSGHGLPSRSSRHTATRPAFAQGGIIVRRRFRCAQAMPDTLRPNGLQRGCATRSPFGRSVVRAVGVEPTRRCHRGILSPLRLPVPPRPLYSGDQVLSAFTGEVELG
jgi:hypothetical protein